MADDHKTASRTMHAENAYALLGILQKHAPRASAQEQMSVIHNSINDPRERETQLCEILVNGLRTNRWPWNS